MRLSARASLGRRTGASLRQRDLASGAPGGAGSRDRRAIVAPVQSRSSALDQGPDPGVDRCEQARGETSFSHPSKGALCGESPLVRSTPRRERRGGTAPRSSSRAGVARPPEERVGAAFRAGLAPGAEGPARPGAPQFRGRCADLRAPGRLGRHGAAACSGLFVFIVRAIDVPRPVDWAFCLAMFFQGWGNALHLFSDFWWYDNCVHITLPDEPGADPVHRLLAAGRRARTGRARRHTSELVGMALITLCLG